MGSMKWLIAGVLVAVLFIATPYGQSSIINLTNDGWLVGPGNNVPVLIGSNGKGYLKVDGAGAITTVNGASFSIGTSGTLSLPAGSATATSLNWGDPLTGFYVDGANNVQISLAGVLAYAFTGFAQQIKDDGASIVLGTTDSVQWFRSAADVMGTDDSVLVVGGGVGVNTAAVPAAGIVNALTDVQINGVSTALGVAAGYKVARGSTALDGSNPTTIATGLTTVVSCVSDIRRTTAVTSGTAFVTHAVPSGANVDFYAWVLAGTASTGTEPVDWVCVGT